MPESRIIPDRVDVQIKILLPPEATTILRDLHQDRQAVGWGALLLLGCFVFFAASRKKTIRN